MAATDSSLTLHTPHGAPRGSVIVVPPFAEELKAAQRALVELAASFAACGFRVCRLDFAGTGDSLTDHADVDLENWLAQVRTAIAGGRRHSPDLPLHLLGLRFGATLAWLAAAETAEVDTLMLWEPIVSGATYMRQNRQRSQIRSELTSGETQSTATGDEQYPAFDFDGFAVSAALHRQMAAVDLLQAALPHCRAVHTLQISGSSRIKKPLEELQARVVAGGLEGQLDSVAVEAFWSAIGLVDTAPVRAATFAPLGLEPPARPPIDATRGGLTGAGDPAWHARLPVIMRDGDRALAGQLYRPQQPATRVLVLLHGWSGCRIGPGRILAEAAQAFANAGYAALTFDFGGRGESDGDPFQTSLRTMIDDAEAAIRSACDQTGCEQVTLVGLCSGAEVALAASLADPRVDSLALWSAPIFSGEFTLARQARRGQAALRGYARKLLRPDTWAKLVSGRLNWRLIWRAASGQRSNEDAAVEDKAPDTNTQMEAFRAFQGRLLFVYGGNDPEATPSWTFYRDLLTGAGIPVHYHQVAGANHNFYGLHWKQDVIRVTLDFLAAQRGGETS